MSRGTKKSHGVLYYINRYDTITIGARREAYVAL